MLTNRNKVQPSISTKTWVIISFVFFSGAVSAVGGGLNIGLKASVETKSEIDLNDEDLNKLISAYERFPDLVAEALLKSSPTIKDWIFSAQKAVDSSLEKASCAASKAIDELEDAGSKVIPFGDKGGICGDIDLENRESRANNPSLKFDYELCAFERDEYVKRPLKKSDVLSHHVGLESAASKIYCFNELTNDVGQTSKDKYVVAKAKIDVIGLLWKNAPDECENLEECLEQSSQTALSQLALFDKKDKANMESDAKEIFKNTNWAPTTKSSGIFRRKAKDAAFAEIQAKTLKAAESIHRALWLTQIRADVRRTQFDKAISIINTSLDLLDKNTPQRITVQDIAIAKLASNSAAVKSVRSYLDSRRIGLQEIVNFSSENKNQILSNKDYADLNTKVKKIQRRFAKEVQHQEIIAGQGIGFQHKNSLITCSNPILTDSLNYLNLNAGFHIADIRLTSMKTSNCELDFYTNVWATQASALGYLQVFKDRVRTAIDSNTKWRKPLIETRADRFLPKPTLILVAK